MNTVPLSRWPVHPRRLALPRLTVFLIERDYSSVYIDDILDHAIRERSLSGLVEAEYLDSADLDPAKDVLREDLADRCLAIRRDPAVAIDRLDLYPPEFDDLGDAIPFLGDRLVHEC